MDLCSEIVGSINNRLDFEVIYSGDFMYSRLVIGTGIWVLGYAFQYTLPEYPGRVALNTRLDFFKL